MCPLSTAVNGPTNAKACQHSSFNNIKEQRTIREAELYVKLRDSCLILRQSQILYVSYHVVTHVGRITRSRQMYRVSREETNIAASTKCAFKNLLAASIIY